jgi:hypothetical protein
VLAEKPYVLSDADLNALVEVSLHDELGSMLEQMLTLLEPIGRA